MKMKPQRTKHYMLIFLITLLAPGCVPPTANFVKVDSFTPQYKLVILPVLAPADISSIASFALEKQLSASGHKFVSSNKVKEFMLNKKLLDQYQAFVKKRETIGVIDSTFFKSLSLLGNYFMLVKVTAWAQGGNYLVDALTKSSLQRTIESANNQVSAGETLVGLSSSVYSNSGNLVYQDTSKARLSDPFNPPSFEVVAGMASFRFGMTLPKSHETFVR